MQCFCVGLIYGLMQTALQYTIDDLWLAVDRDLSEGHLRVNYSLLSIAFAGKYVLSCRLTTILSLPIYCLVADCSMQEGQ